MQTMGTITETQTASYRTVHDILRFAPRWPDPKSCCGVLFCVFDNKDKCWEATNRVRSTYNDNLRSAIDEILDDEEDRLGQDARYRPFFCHSIYMVGRKQKRSNPVIFFCCEDASLRIKARDVVKASAIMRNHAAIRLGHTSFPPEFNAPPRFAAEAQARMVLKDDELPLQSAGRLSSSDIRASIPSLDSLDNFMSHLKSSGLGKSQRTWDILPKPPSETDYLRTNRLRRNQHKASMVVSTDSEEAEPKSDSMAKKIQQVPSIQEPPLVQQHPSTFLSTTKEGRREAGSIFLALIYANYPMKSLCGVQIIARGRTQYGTRPNRSWRPEDGIKMTMGGAILLDGNIYGLTAAHGLVKDHLSAQGSPCLVRSVEYDGDSGVGFEDSDNNSEDEDEPMGESAIRFSSHFGTRHEAEDLISPQNENQKGKGVASGQDQILSMKDATPFGIIIDSSTSNGSLGLDWALIEIFGDMPSQVNEYLYDNKVSGIHGIATSLPSRSPVLAILARSSISGMILGTSVSMRLPGSRKMCEVWTVNLSEPIEDGDCGALVINPSNGNVYGHIVAGNIGTGFAYVIPFHQTQVEISRQVGSKNKPTFATAGDYRQWMSLKKEETPGIRVSSALDDGKEATAERVPNPTELQRQDAFQASAGVELVNEPKKKNPLAKEEDADYRPALDPNKGRGQIAYEHSTEKNRTSDEAVLPKFEHKRHTVEESTLRPTFRTTFRKVLASRKASGSSTKGNAGHVNHPGSSGLAGGNEQSSIEFQWISQADPIAAHESPPTSSTPIVSRVSKSEMEFNMPTVPKPEPSSKFSAFVKKVLHPKQKEELPNFRVPTGEYVGILPGPPEGSSIWRAAGPARDLWKQLAPRITDLIDGRQGVDAHPLVLDMFMVGKTVEATTPTIFVMCEDRTIHKKVIKLVTESSILDQFPGVNIYPLCWSPVIPDKQ